MSSRRHEQAEREMITREATDVVKVIAAIIGGAFVLLWPEAAFHRNPVQGHFTLTPTGWIVQILWIVFLAVVVLGVWLLNRRVAKK